MAGPSRSPKIAKPESSKSNRALSTSNVEQQPQAPNQQSGASHGPVAVLWDIENCPVPRDVCPEDVAGNILEALRVHAGIEGPITVFSAYGDFNAIIRWVREGCQRTGVNLLDVPNGRKDAADKAILVDMLLFALDNRPPSSIMLISGDVDFAPALHKLGQRGYTIILVIPSGVRVSPALRNAGRFVWDWPSVARGKRSVECTTRAFTYGSTPVSRELSRLPGSLSGYNRNNLIGGTDLTSSRSQCLPSGSSEGPVKDQNSTREKARWVLPGDTQGLEGQLVSLLEMSGGSLLLERVHSEYSNFFGRQLYTMDEMMLLFEKMDDVLVVIGEGPEKLLCLRARVDGRMEGCPSTAVMTRSDKKGKGVLEDGADVGVCPHIGSSSNASFNDWAEWEASQSSYPNFGKKPRIPKSIYIREQKKKKKGRKEMKKKREEKKN